MARYRFVDPDVVRLEISDGDWVEIKKELTYGERQRMVSAGMTGLRLDTSGGDDRTPSEIGMDWAVYNVVKLQTWLVDWSFRDREDRPVALSRSAIENLDDGTAEEILAVIDAYEDRLEVEKKAAGKAPGPTPATLTVPARTR